LGYQCDITDAATKQVDLGKRAAPTGPVSLATERVHIVRVVVFAAVAAFVAPLVIDATSGNCAVSPCGWAAGSIFLSPIIVAFVAGWMVGRAYADRRSWPWISLAVLLSWVAGAVSSLVMDPPRDSGEATFGLAVVLILETPLVFLAGWLGGRLGRRSKTDGPHVG